VTSLVFDEIILRDYIKSLPELKDGEGFLCTVLNRNKHGAVRTRKLNDRIAKSHDGLEALVHEFADRYGKSTGVPIIYVNPRPRSYLAAAQKMFVEMSRAAAFTGLQDIDIHKMSKSILAGAKSGSGPVVFDLDGEEFRSLNFVQNKLNAGSWLAINTRGGVHLHVSPDKVSHEYRATWFKEIDALADNSGDLMSPVPGTLQAGHKVSFLA